MKKSFVPWKELGLAVAFTAFSSVFFGQFLGVASSRFDWTVFAQVYEPDFGTGACSDGQDNDNDGAIDCGNVDCLGTPPCIAAAPVLGTGGLVASSLLLLGVGGAAIALARRRTA